jgi:hypothetical protein
MPSLGSNHGFEQCQNLIRQAETLVQESRDTFWVPIGDNGEEIDNGEQLSDLEFLAKEIYLRHIKAYNLNNQNPGDNLNQKSLNAMWSNNEASIQPAQPKHQLIFTMTRMKLWPKAFALVRSQPCRQ